ncbi:phage replisome organizer N-terminal domain-containing protein [Enterococcus sp. DIV0800]|uniref:phage replisome organizer N-terminal domain-containing protein n=1 Tax=unclassified Enterococcus TaxID=2608891 RepID=UPI003D2FA067
MAEISWIKLKTTMFDDEKIRLIQAVPESDAILVIWIRLLVLAGKTNDEGLIYIQRNMPYSEEMLSTLFGKPVNVVRLALTTLEKFNMIDLNTDGSIAITNWEKHQNIEGMEKVREQNRLRKQRQRGKQKLLSDHAGQSRDSHATDIDIELDTETDKEIKNIYIYRFECFWKQYPKKTQKKKAVEQFKKKVKNDSDLAVFEKGYSDYLKYIEITDWYHPQELFRWIRDERYKDEYDLTAKRETRGKIAKNRVEELPKHISSPKKKTDEIDMIAEADRIMEERRKNEGL